MLRDRWFRIGVAAFLVGALCCFTPAAVIALGGMGLAAYAIWIDAVAMPLLIAGAGIVAASCIRLRQSKT